MPVVVSAPPSGGSGGGEVTQGTDPWIVTHGTTVTVDGTVTAVGPLTDAELRASGIVVLGPLTDAQLRAAAVAISAASLPLPAGAAKDSTLTDGTQRVGGTLDVSDRAARLAGVVSGGANVFHVDDNAGSLTVDGAVSVSNFPATQPISAAALPLPATAAKDSTLTDGTARIGGTVAVSGPLTDAQLRAAVVPVGDGGGSLTVDGTVSATQGTTPWKAREDTAAMTWVSVKSAAPTASAVQADTGALPAGDYDFDIYLLVSDTVAVGKGLVVEHRNAANGATPQTIGGVDAPDSLYFPIRRYTMASNERLRIIAGTAAGAASSMYVSAIGRRVS